MPSRLSLLLLLLTTVLPGRLMAAGNPPVIDPAGLSGSIILAGAGTVPADARQAFVDLAGKAKARIVLLVLAGDSMPDPKMDDRELQMWRDLKPESVTRLEMGHSKAANDPEIVKALSEASGVWLGGSDSSKLAAAIRGTPLEKEVKKLHARGGVVGSAAASAALLSDLVVTGGAGAQKSEEGLGLLPGFVIDAHHQRKSRERLARVISINPQWVGLGIAEGAAVVIRGRVARVIGSGEVTIHVAKGAGHAAAADSHATGALLDIVQLRRAAANRASSTPFPPAKPPEPVVEKGSLVIIGGGGAAPEIWKRFIELSGGPDALIVVIPTAMEDPLAKESAEERALKRNGATNVKSLHTRSPREANDPQFSEILTRAGGVWFSGGRQWHFVDAYAGTLTEKRFHEVLARGGAIGGSSAGASIQSEYMPRGHPLGNSVMAAEGYEQGFGFLPGCAVDQHFIVRKRLPDMIGLMKLHPQYLGIGLDEGTAIVVHGCEAEVIGKSKVAIFDTRKKLAQDQEYEELQAGDHYDLKMRKKIVKGDG